MRSLNILSYLNAQFIANRCRVEGNDQRVLLFTVINPQYPITVVSFVTPQCTTSDLQIGHI